MNLSRNVRSDRDRPRGRGQYFAHLVVPAQICKKENGINLPFRSILYLQSNKSIVYPLFHVEHVAKSDISASKPSEARDSKERKRLANSCYLP